MHLIKKLSILGASPLYLLFDVIITKNVMNSIYLMRKNFWENEDLLLFGRSYAIAEAKSTHVNFEDLAALQFYAKTYLLKDTLLSFNPLHVFYLDDGYMIFDSNRDSHISWYEVCLKLLKIYSNLRLSIAHFPLQPDMDTGVNLCKKSLILNLLYLRSYHLTFDTTKVAVCNVN